MEEFSERHRLYVANFFSGKVKELRFQLATIVAGCDESLGLIGSGSAVPDTTCQAVIYGFSAFSNTIQILKDAVKTVTKEPLAWSEIERLRHGAFMKNARNAATHDGNPVITGWADGRYFIPAKITRIAYDQIVEIPAPTEDVRTICLDFTIDFCHLLRDVLSVSENVGQLKGVGLNIEDLEAAFANSTVIPAFAQEIFAQQRGEIEAALKQVKRDPIAKAILELNEVIQYCDSATVK